MDRRGLKSPYSPANMWTRDACETFAHAGKKNKRMNARAISILFGLALLGASGAVAQEPSDPMAARLSADRVGGVAAGDYSAADDINFTLLPYGDKYLLRFDDSPENFVLYGDRVALGGRELKYDTGALALKVSVWGGVTLYTQQAPSGIPATRNGEATAPPRIPVTAASLTAALADEASHIAYVQQLKLRFSADDSILKNNDDVKANAFDTLVTSAMGI